MKRKILSFIIALCMLLSTAYAYPDATVSEDENSIEVFGGAAYVLSFTVDNSSEEFAEINILDESGNILGGARAKTTNGEVMAYSMPIVMPKAADKSGKVGVTLEKNIPSGAAVDNIKLSFASWDIVNCVQQEDVLTVRGNIGGASDGQLEVYVLAEAEEYEYSDPAKQLQYDVLKVKRNSTYSLTVDTSEIEKYYTDITVFIKGLTSLGYSFDGAAIDFMYTKTTFKDELVEKIKAAESINEVKSLIEGGDEELSNRELLGISEVKIAAEFTQQDFLYEYLFNNKSRITLDTLSDLVIEACMLEAMASDEITDSELAQYIDEYAEVLELTDEKFTPYTTAYKNLNTAEKQTVAADIRKDSGINTPEKLRASLADAALKTAMNTASSYVGVIKILSENSEYLKLEIPSGLGSTEQRAIADYAMNTSDVMSIKDEIDRIISSVSTENSGTSGGRGGGGGGGSVSVGSFVKAPETVDTKNELSKTERFSDLSDSEWAKEYINSMADKGILKGYADGSFRPNNSITRAEFVKVIAEAFSLCDENAESEFEDVPKDDWSYKYVSSLYALGIVNGVGEKSFGKDENISRQDMAVILHRVAMMKQLEVEETAMSFTDAENISEYAIEAVAAMQALGAVSGMGDGRFEPFGYTTRAQAAKVVYTLTGLLK